MAGHALHFSCISVPSKTKRRSLWPMARWMSSTCWATTDSTCEGQKVFQRVPTPGNHAADRRQPLQFTSRSIRLNSSKHAQAPLEARPLKNFPIAM